MIAVGAARSVVIIKGTEFAGRKPYRLVNIHKANFDVLLTDSEMDKLIEIINRGEERAYLSETTRRK